MTRIAYVNGHYVAHRHASVHVEDRGYQFADGVYEVIVFYNHTLVDGEAHIKRLIRSLRELGIQPPMGEAALRMVIREAIDRNGLANGSVYIQSTRGVAKRDHLFKSGVRPSLVVTVTREKPVAVKEITRGTEVVTRKDIRWDRRDIKSVGLLPNVLLKNEAASLGKRETWLLDNNGYVTEGAVSNAFIVTKDGKIITRGTENCILPGITRMRVLALAEAAGMPVEERPFTAEEVKTASEAFLTSSTSHVVPVVKIDETLIGDGKPGKVTRKLFDLYAGYIEQQTGRRIWQP